MTNNEPVMIHGVDVSKCEFFCEASPRYCTCRIDGYGDAFGDCPSIEETDCYFKQLTRKTQECEELKKQIKTLSVQKELYDSYCRTHCSANSIAIDLCTEFDFMEHQQITSIIEEGIRILRFQRDRYKQALAEIEEYIKEEDWSPLPDYVIRDIGNIINKAKGEGND